MQMYVASKIHKQKTGVWRKEQDPDLYPLVIGMDPLIRIRT